ncbi:MAG: hypothetical protein V4439_02090 [Patescibacteria group bacterium]
MIEILKNVIKKEMVKLPKTTQEIFNLSDFEKQLDEISKEYFQDDEEKINNFQAETVLLLLGVNPLNNYAKKVAYSSILAMEDAEKITKKAIEKIFIPLAEKVNENIKSKLKSKNPKYDQNMKFILSGGDYSHFLENPNMVGTVVEEEQPKYVADTFSKVEDLKNKFVV